MSTFSGEPLQAPFCSSQAKRAVDDYGLGRSDDVGANIPAPIVDGEISNVNAARQDLDESLRRLEHIAYRLTGRERDVNRPTDQSKNESEKPQLVELHDEIAKLRMTARQLSSLVDAFEMI